jgi:hypothetical protein
MDEMRFNPIIPEEKGEEKIDSVKPKIWQKIKIKHILFVLILLVVIVSIGFAVNFYLKAQKLESEVQASAVNEVQKIVAEVGKLIVLPKNEEPTVATISDVEKLRGQPFFANARNGDKVLIYTKAQKAILYDPTQNIIVEVAPLNSGTSANTAKTQ